MNENRICHLVCNFVRVMLRMQVYLEPSHPQQGQLNSVDKPYDELGLVWDCGERVVDTDHHILMVVAIKMIDL